MKRVRAAFLVFFLLVILRNAKDLLTTSGNYDANDNRSNDVFGEPHF